MIVLDTHIWLWWVNGDGAKLKATWLSAIESADAVGVSAISCFELAWLAGHGRIKLPTDSTQWFADALAGSGIELLPITPAIGLRAVGLAEHHSDPQDRLIIATALEHGAQLISADSKFPLYAELEGCLLS